MAAGAESANVGEERILRANTDQLLPHEQVERELGAQWSGLGLWLRWVLATAAGWLVSGFVTGLFAGALGSVDHVVTVGATYVMTLVTLTLQWLVLRPRLPRAWRWIPVSVAGEAAALVLWLAVQASMGPLLDRRGDAVEALIRTFVEGLPPAVAQWLLLRSVVRGAWRWIAANLVWIVAFALLGSANAGGELAPSLELAITLAIITALYGTALGAFASGVTGVALVPLLRNPRADAQTRR